MKRFVDLRGAETGNLFAFYCTVVDKFEEFGGDQTWSSIHEFKDSFRLALHSGEVRFKELDRYLRLIPAWVPEKESEPIPLL